MDPNEDETVVDDIDNDDTAIVEEEDPVNEQPAEKPKKKVSPKKDPAKKGAKKNAVSKKKGKKAPKTGKKVKKEKAEKVEKTPRFVKPRKTISIAGEHYDELMDVAEGDEFETAQEAIDNILSKGFARHRALRAYDAKKKGSSKKKSKKGKK